MMYNDIISVSFEDEINQVDRTQTMSKRVVKIDIKETSMNISISSQSNSLKFYIKMRYSDLYNFGKF